jgi:glycosyltransferase involved in cell wall biosynthesis
MVGAVGGRLVPLLYVSNGNIPSRWAHTVQIMKMSEAMSNQVPGFALLIAGDAPTLVRGNKGLLDRYGVQRRFRILKLPMAWRLPEGALNRSNWRAFSQRARTVARWLRPHVVMTRCHESADYALRDGLRVIFETHDGPGHPKTMRYIERFARDPNLLGVVTTSEVLKQAFVDAGVSDTLVLAVPNAADVTRFDRAFPNVAVARGLARQQLGLSSADHIALYAGSLMAYKGVGILINAAALTPDVRFLVVGGDADAVAHWRDQAWIPSNIEFVGFVKGQALQAYFAAADVCLVPNSKTDRTARWTFSLKMYEYMAARRPIIASDIPSLRDALAHGERGLLVPPDDGGALRDAIYKLRAQPDLAEGLAARGRAWAESWTWDDRARRVMEAFAPTLLRRRRR